MTTTDYVVYSIANCKYCELAKTLLRDKNRVFTDIAADMKPELAKTVVERTGSRTWPQVFYRGQFVGGYTELKALLDA